MTTSLKAEKKDAFCKYWNKAWIWRCECASLPAAVSEALTPEPKKDVMQSEAMRGELPEHETQGNNIDISYELPAEGAKLNNLMAGLRTRFQKSLC